MAETPVNKLPYPTDADAPDGPVQIKALADALDVLKLGSRNLKPTIDIISASGDLTLTGSYQDVPGCVLEYTPPIAMNLFVLAIFEMQGSPGECWGSIKLDEEAESAALAKSSNDAGTDRHTVSQVYKLALSAAKHTIKLRAKKGPAEANNTGIVRTAGTRFLYLAVAQ